MKSIGFKNFRKFEDFPEMEFSPITILVGENNAGKSTVTKAMLLMQDFLNGKSIDIDNLYVEDIDRKILFQAEPDYSLLLKKVKVFFNTNYFTHIASYDRALFSQHKEDAIVFSCSYDQFLIKYKIVRDKDNALTNGLLQSVSIKLNKFFVTLDFDLFNDSLDLIFDKIDLSNVSGQINTRYVNEFNGMVDSVSYVKSIKLSKCWKYHSYVELGFIGSLFYSIYNLMNDNYGSDNDLDNEVVRLLSAYQNALNLKKDNNLRMLMTYIQDVKKTKVDYLYAHSVNQSVTYNSRDNNDYISRTVLDLVDRKISANTSYGKFIVEWMVKYNIGSSYRYSTTGGESITIEILDSNGNAMFLADKGMGSIQMITLLFRIAITQYDADKLGKHSVILMEEPEQNLHPKYQSLLADLLFDVYKKYNTTFVIETHSEYLVRNTQVFVRSKFFKRGEQINDVVTNDTSINPFKVMYFPVDGNPYQMKYRTDGRFSRKFGSGFYDEASNLTFKLL